MRKRAAQQRASQPRQRSREGLSRRRRPKEPPLALRRSVQTRVRMHASGAVNTVPDLGRHVDSRVLAVT